MEHIISQTFDKMGRVYTQVDTVKTHTGVLFSDERKQTFKRAYLTTSKAFVFEGQKYRGFAYRHGFDEGDSQIYSHTFYFRDRRGIVKQMENGMRDKTQLLNELKLACPNYFEQEHGAIEKWGKLYKQLGFLLGRVMYMGVESKWEMVRRLNGLLRLNQQTTVRVSSTPSPETPMCITSLAYNWDVMVSNQRAARLFVDGVESAFASETVEQFLQSRPLKPMLHSQADYNTHTILPPIYLTDLKKNALSSNPFDVGHCAEFEAVRTANANRCLAVIEAAAHPDRIERMMALYGDEWELV